MEQNLQQDILLKLKRRKMKRFWSKLVSVMMCVVVFCTTYALILPAITAETDTFCGLEEHIHTGDCYSQQKNLVCEFCKVICPSITFLAYTYGYISYAKQCA